MTPPPVFEPLSKEFLEFPTEVFARMRAEAPVFRHGNERWPFISIFRYASIRAALTNWKVWSSDIPEFRELVLGDAAIMIQDDPPLHSQYRNVLAPYVSREHANSATMNISGVTRAVLLKYLDQEVDFVPSIAEEISFSIVSRLVGIPNSETPYLRDITKRLSDAVGLEFVETDQKKLDAQASLVGTLHEELSHFIRALARGKTASDGLISKSSAWGLSDRERLALLKSLIYGGSRTTAVLLANAVWLLAAHPRELESLREGRVSAAVARNEILRMKGVFRGATRVATADGQLDGTRFKKGDYLLAWITSGNFDEAVFANPREFQIARDPVQHLSYAVGPHYCVGAHYASNSLDAFLETVQKEIGAITLSQKPIAISDPWVDGFQSLHVRLSGHV